MSRRKTKITAEDTPEVEAVKPEELLENQPAKERPKKSGADKAEPAPDFTLGETVAEGEPASAAVPDHLAPKISLEDYAGLRNLTAFQLGALRRSVGSYDRIFEDWESARQSILGG